MSRFFSDRHSALTPYTPGEQLNISQLIKLNTNESPFEPTKRVRQYAENAAGRLNLYPELDSGELRRLLSEILGVGPDNIFISNSSDEALNFSFLAFFDKNRPAAFADITYDFYKVFCELYHIPYRELPLCDDFSLNISDYSAFDGNIVIANPNAPTGLFLNPDKIEYLAKKNRNRIIIVDEAYVDFGAESCVPLTKKYDNIIVTQTFSKSRALAGARLGYAVAGREIIKDLETLRYSTNPYNVNRMSVAAGTAALIDNDIYMDRCRQITETREWFFDELRKLGFEGKPSLCNFVFVRHGSIGGAELQRRLREKNILIRHFNKTRIEDYNRITIGTRQQMETLLAAIREILEG